MSEVLVFIDWYLPGYKAGGPVTSCANMIDALRDEVRFKIVTGDRDYCATEKYPSVDFDSWVVRGHHEEVLYLSQEQQTYQNIKRIIAETPCDTIYINGIYSRKFSIYPILALRSLKKERHVVVASRGMLSKSAIGVKRIKKSIFLRVAKWLGWYRDVAFHATNEKEQQDIRREIGKNKKVYIASNVSRQPQNEIKLLPKEKGTLRLISIARIAPEKNLLFLLRALEKVHSSIELGIYGSIYNQSYWDHCQEVIARLPKAVKVEYKGFAEPAKIQGIIQSYHALALPSLGENYGHVIAESLISGRPVLISDQTPWRGLKERKAGWVMPLDEYEFARAIDHFAGMDNEEFYRWQRGAFERGKEISSDPKPRRDHLAMFRNE